MTMNGVEILASTEIVKDIAFNYMMLSRLQLDCKYYLGYGNRNKKHLWVVFL